MSPSNDVPCSHVQSPLTLRLHGKTEVKAQVFITNEQLLMSHRLHFYDLTCQAQQLLEQFRCGSDEGSRAMLQPGPAAASRCFRSTGLGSTFCSGDAIFCLVQHPQRHPMPGAKASRRGMLACPTGPPPRRRASGGVRMDGRLSKRRICPTAHHKQGDC